ncbi:MAG: serine/threonine protein kinase, partial [Myxococcales bacterium]|nr:serine/threonine protein kinase [Myxococcales bacterium]
MTEFWGRVKEIFFDALDLEPEEVPAFLDAACGDDPQLRAAVERLLAEDEQSGTRLEPPWDRLLEKEVGEGATKIDTLGDFDLLREIGRGGRGIVYLARQRSTGRRVALKVLDRAARVDPLQRERFRREAVATARLDHPGIVGVLEAGEQDGIPFLAMEFVAGTSLADELRQGPAGRLFGSTDEPRVVIAARCVARIAEALEHAHSRDVVHRDVKPQNILVDARLEPRLVDFGLARDLAEITITLDLEGTPNYMSPEQIAQQRLLVDHRTDIYSLGVILYEMLTGTRPFAAPTAAQILHNVTSLIPKPVRRLAPDVPIDLETICHCAMAKRPSDRYRSAGGLAADLESFLAHRAIAARPPGPIARATAWADRHRVACTVLLLLTLVLGGILLQPVVAHAMAAGELAGRLDAAAVRIAAGELPADL